MHRLFFLLLLVVVNGAHAQRKRSYERVFHVSITPGLGTNGTHPGGYTNAIALHLTSGYAAANRLLEIAGISNFNITGTRGLQIAGLVNLTGGNAFAGMQPKEQDMKVKSGFEANLTGIQFSGITNHVLNNVFGVQVSGGVNVTRGALLGFQVGGLMNVVYNYSFGVQLAGLASVSYASMDGVQLSTLLNYTHGGLYGLQIGCYNRAGFMEGKNSYENHDATGLQIGLLNVAETMNGFQIGLINRAKRSQGTQIGLINLYRTGKTIGTRDGTAIGLVNVGGSGYFSAYANELFYSVVEIATGNSKNTRIETDKFLIEIQNSLIYANDASFLRSGRSRWALGYGLKKMYFNRSATPGMTRYRFMSFGVDLLHINERAGTITRSFNLITRPSIGLGTRLHPRLHNIYVTGSLAWNAYVSDQQKSLNAWAEHATTIRHRAVFMWPGFSLGVLIM